MTYNIEKQTGCMPGNPDSYLPCVCVYVCMYVCTCVHVFSFGIITGSCDDQSYPEYLSADQGE